MSQQIVSIYTFEIRKNASESQLLEASAKVDAILLGMPGFLYRSLTKTQDGRWQDVIYFDSEETLKRADALENNSDFVRFMSLIASHTVKNVKAALYSSVYPGMKIDADQYVEMA